MSAFHARVDQPFPDVRQVLDFRPEEVNPLTAGGFAGYTIPGNTSTTEVLPVNGARNETLEFASDRDWFRLTVDAGQTVQIDLTGVDHDPGNGLGALSDPYLRVYDINGALLVADDDSGPGYNSSLILTNTDTTVEQYHNFWFADVADSNIIGTIFDAVCAIRRTPPMITIATHTAMITP